MTKITAGKPILSNNLISKDISTLNPFWLGQKEKRLFACFCSHKITHLHYSVSKGMLQ
jgi:hypothetical protein